VVDSGCSRNREGSAGGGGGCCLCVPVIVSIGGSYPRGGLGLLDGGAVARWTSSVNLDGSGGPWGFLDRLW